MATEPERTYPSELPVLALRQTVVFPLTIQPLAINRAMSVETVNRALNRLWDEHLIDMRAATIVIAEPDKLRALLH